MKYFRSLRASRLLIATHTLVVYCIHVFRADMAFCHLERRRKRAIGKQALANPLCEQIDHQPKRIHQIMLDQRLQQIAASPNVQIQSGLLLDFGNLSRNISVQEYAWLPFTIHFSIRGEVPGCRVDALPCISMVLPVWRPYIIGLTP